MFLRNKSKLPQIVQLKSNIFPATIYPKMVFSYGDHGAIDKEAFEEYDPENLRNTGQMKIAFVRKFALGDLLQLIPVIRIVKKRLHLNDVTILTTTDLGKVLSWLYRDLKFGDCDSHTSYERFDLTYSLEGYLEQDHSLGNPQNGKHRVNIFLEAMGLNIPIKKEDLDWRPTNLDNFKLSKSEMKTIGVQLRGSGVIKTLPTDVMRKMIDELAKKYRVVLIDPQTSNGFEGTNILNLCGKTTVMQCAALLTKLDACITMDSGVLWLAHAANCPVVTILGPTREHERLSLHPGYPEKAKSVSISKDIIGCEPCFETKTYCKGAINCMKNFDSNVLIQMVSQKLFEILGE